MRVTTDFGASYFINGNRYVNLIFFLKYRNESSGFTMETFYATCSNKDEHSEDAFYTRAVWDHLLRSDGANYFAQWDEIKLLRDSGPHFQNNNIVYFESTIESLYGKKFTVSAFAKRHGWNECDGAMARFVEAIKAASLESMPPLDTMAAVSVINHHAKFENCIALAFKKIDRDPALFPAKSTDFVGIRKLQLCEFVYEWIDYDGRRVAEPGWVLARAITGEGAWVMHDFLPHTMPPAWKQRCNRCSNALGRAVFHERLEEPIKVCMPLVVREATHPDPDLVDEEKQPVPRSQLNQNAPGPTDVFCNWCPKVWRHYKLSGIKRHTVAKHPGQAVSTRPAIPLQAGTAGGEVAEGKECDGSEDEASAPVQQSPRRPRRKVRAASSIISGDDDSDEDSSSDLMWAPPTPDRQASPGREGEEGAGGGGRGDGPRARRAEVRRGDG